MRDSHELFEIARRAKKSEPPARSVLEALSGQAPVANGGPHSHALSPMDPRLVDDLIARAESHPLGVEFLSEGSLDSVSAGFGTHAFTVEAARERLRSEAPPLPGEGNAE
ncbi:MAG: hypothetical protein HYY18_06165 [Planctomycetes bacterium]|nr:hypothetical protein [Planctomycetota bacterium]